MSMKGIVELIKFRITPMDSEKGEMNITRSFHREDCEGLDGAIAALEDYPKLKKLWNSFEELYGQFMIPVKGKKTLIKKLMIDMEIDNGYFPKEEKENDIREKRQES